VGRVALGQDVFIPVATELGPNAVGGSAVSGQSLHLLRHEPLTVAIPILGMYPAFGGQAVDRPTQDRRRMIVVPTGVGYPDFVADARVAMNPNPIGHRPALALFCRA